MRQSSTGTRFTLAAREQLLFGVATILCMAVVIPRIWRSDGFDTVPVSGRVTLDGVALADAYVIFEPSRTEAVALDVATLPGSSGKTDSKGRYTLAVPLTGKRGAVAGPHRVRITKLKRDPGTNQEGTTQDDLLDVVPWQYNVETRLTFTVPDDGTEKADFDLQSDGK